MPCPISRFASAILIAGLLVGTVAAQESRHHHRHHGSNDFVCRDADDGNPDLFYNYYVGDGCDWVGAQMYVAPQPVPPWVGHTYITYQPLMPHELLYKHHHHYYRYYDGGRGMTRAAISYYNPPLRTGLVDLRNHLRLPR
jgi:hypothetical protein